MAKIWPVYEGRSPTQGQPWAKLSLSEITELFDLSRNQFVSGLDSPPRFGEAERDFSNRGYRHVVVEVEEDDAQELQWKPGFYRLAMKPESAFDRLVEHAVVKSLGRNNVVRVTYEVRTDSQGHNVLSATVVIPPGAIDRLKGGATVDALVNLQSQLRAMLPDHIVDIETETPTIEYATEAELAQDAGYQS